MAAAKLLRWRRNIAHCNRADAYQTCDGKQRGKLRTFHLSSLTLAAAAAISTVLPLICGSGTLSSNFSFSGPPYSCSTTALITYLPELQVYSASKSDALGADSRLNGECPLRSSSVSSSRPAHFGFPSDKILCRQIIAGNCQPHGSPWPCPFGSAELHPESKML